MSARHPCPIPPSYRTRLTVRSDWARRRDYASTSQGKSRRQGGGGGRLVGKGRPTMYTGKHIRRTAAQHNWGNE